MIIANSHTASFIMSLNVCSRLLFEARRRRKIIKLTTIYVGKEFFSCLQVFTLVMKLDYYDYRCFFHWICILIEELRGDISISLPKSPNNCERPLLVNNFIISHCSAFNSNMLSRVLCTRKSLLLAIKPP